MLALAPSRKLFFYTGICDMRKGFNGLSGIISHELNRAPCDGSIYCFVNKRRDRIKLLLFEGDGFAVYYKVLAQGTLELPKACARSGYANISPETLRLILSGIKLSSIKHRKRYKKIA